jgi:WD40 repeat protein
MRETNYGLPYYLKQQEKEVEDLDKVGGGEGGGLHSHELAPMVKPIPKPPKKRLFQLFRKAPPRPLVLIENGDIDKSKGVVRVSNVQSRIKGTRVRKSALELREDLQKEKEMLSLKNEGMKLPVNIDMNKNIVVSEGLVRWFNINGNDMVHHGALNDAVFSPSELRVATAGGDKLIKIWDPRDGTYVRALKGHKGSACHECALYF